MYRTIENGNINEKLVGQTVKIIGWVAKKRDLGGLTFVDLRDRSGIVQVLINEGVARPDIRNEYIIQIEGVVTLKEVPNKNLKTGKVEVVASKVTLINKAKNPPLIIADETDALEDVRLKYRYLDLRRKVLQDKLIARAKITKVTREFLDNEGFIEIETPILTKSTPGGARDYLIPSRLNPGTFYALAQSPQIYKQLLMIGGLEKYYQIARCFRDEDLRSDRQPDFTQIDIETSFFTYEEVLDLNERLLQKIFKEVKGYDLKLPLPRLTYHEAVENYGSDKPDLRFDLKIRDLSKVLSNEEYFKAKEDVRGLIINDPTNILSRKTLDELNLIVKQHGLNFLGVLKYDGTAFSGSLAKNITSSHTEVAEALGLAANDVVLLGFDAPLARILSALGAVRKELGVRFNLIDENAYSCLWVDSFPLFSYDPETRRFASEHHPFTQPKEEDIAKLTTAPEEVLSYAYDIVINGYEAGGGSMRIYDQDLQNRIFEILGLSEKEIEYLFGFFIEALKYGTPPHGGIAFGLDRLTMILTGTDDIRDVIAFPKNLKGASLMSGEPSKVSNLQLDELYIKINTGIDGGEE
ncbi:MAG TPA: aspartate--tRNA ligase [Bacilli bacterium]|nr:aspartate--tRNA ligase [Bacilli bacterium]